MGRDNAPVGNTCPTLDNIISLVEDVRGDNESLRDWGNQLHDEVEELERQISQLESDKENLEMTVSELKEQIENLEEQLVEEV